jgi:hypothetical protein
MKNVSTANLILRVCFVFFTIVAIAACGTTRRSIAIEEGWELLGEQKVNFVRDKDAININSSNRFTHIKFRIEDREVRLNDLKITLENGDVLQPALDDVIAADQYSRDIVIATDGRLLREIAFRYRTTGNVLQGRANVLVLGKRYDRGY